MYELGANCVLEPTVSVAFEPAAILCDSMRVVDAEGDADRASVKTVAVVELTSRFTEANLKELVAAGD